MRKARVLLVLVALVASSCARDKPHARATEPDLPTPQAVIESYYSALQRRDFDGAQQLMAAGAVRDRWDDFDDGYPRNLRKLRSFKIGETRPDSFRAYNKQAVDCTITPVTLDVDWKRLVTTRDGIVTRFVQVGRGDAGAPLRIYGEGSGP